MSDTEPHDIWPKVQLGAHEAGPAALLAGGTIVPAAYPTVFGTLLLCQPFWQAAAVILRTKATGVCLLAQERVLLWPFDAVRQPGLLFSHVVGGVSSETLSCQQSSWYQHLATDCAGQQQLHIP